MPLPEVPVSGGTPEARAAARAELVAFDEAVGPGQVELTELVIRPLDDLLGLYQEARRRVSLDDDVPLEDVARITRHELCHALLHQQDLAREPEPTLDAFADWLYAPDGADIPRERSPDVRRSEAAAELCEMGPLRAYALTRPCPDDPPRAADAYGWVDANVWRGDRPEPWTLQEPSVTFTAPHPFQSALVTATDLPGRVAIVLGRGDGQVEVHGADLMTGAPAAAGAILAPPVAPEGTGAVWGLEGGPLLEVVDFPWLRSWFEVPAEPRVGVRGGDGVHLVEDACLGHELPWSVFYADGGFWIARGEGQTVTWAPSP